MYENRPTIRPYQEQAISRVAERGRAGMRRLILHSPCGSGKTIMAAEMIRRVRQDLEKRVLFLAPRRELVSQCVAKLEAIGLRTGIIMAGEIPDQGAEVQVACIPTLHTRGVRLGKIDLPPADFVVHDESHLSLAESHVHLLEHYADQGAFVLGLTATPARGDGKGLGIFWEEIVPGPTVSSLVAEGFLVPQRYYAPAKPDLAGIKIRNGDYAEDQLQDRMDTPKLVGDVVTNWLRIAAGKRTVVFASGVQHSIHLRDQFREAGVVAEHLDGTTPTEERKAILARMASGETTVLCNCFVLTYGWDCPSTECAVIARPTKSLVLYLQMAGRALRPAPGKGEALIIDHAGIVDEHGFLDEEFPWSLDGKEKIRDRIEREKKAKKEWKPITCPACSFVFKSSDHCPKCGWRPAERKAEWQDVVDGDLHEVGRKGKRKAGTWTMDEKARFYGELQVIARRKGYNLNWASHKFREKFGVWPNSVRGACEYEPSAETLAWVKSRQIAWAKSRSAPRPAERDRIGNSLWAGLGREAR